MGAEFRRSGREPSTSRAGSAALAIALVAGSTSLSAQAPKFALEMAGPLPDGAVVNLGPAEKFPIVACEIPWPIQALDPTPCLPSPPAPAIAVLRFDSRAGSATDPDLDALGELLARHSNIRSLLLGRVAAGDEERMWAYRARRIGSLARGVRPGIEVAIGPFESDAKSVAAALARDSDATPYFDALLLSGSGDIRTAAGSFSSRLALWESLDLSTGPSETGDPVDETLEALTRIVERLKPGNPPASLLLLTVRSPQDFYPALARLCAYFSGDVFAEERAALATRSDGSTLAVPRFLRGGKQTTLLLVADPGGGRISVGLDADQPFRVARVQNLATGARRDFDVPARARALALETSGGPLAVELVPADPGGGERSRVEVFGERVLTAEEIVARERAWEAVQRERLRSYTGTLTTSMRLRIGELGESFDLTIRGPVFAERGKPSDWAWHEFYVNGIRWKGRTVPRLPILQPEKVHSLPLEIDLSEAYQYELAGQTTLAGHPVYVIDFSPRRALAEAAAYRGRVWIDSKTFVRRRERLVQMNLKGETLSNVETSDFEPAPGAPDIWLPLTIRGEQVFSTAGRTTSVQRRVTLSGVAVNAPDFAARREDAYRSDSQMVRDTDQGLRYLLRGGEPGERTIAPDAKPSRLFGIAGLFSDGSLSYPLPLFGIDYSNFNVGGRGTQANLFFGGLLLTANYSDPSLFGSRFDAGADLFAFAVPFGDSVFRNGKDVKTEKIRNRPLRLQVNGGVPLGPYLKLSLTGFLNENSFSRAPETSPDFSLPANGDARGGRLQLVARLEGYSLSLQGEGASRAGWRFWGEPGNRDFNPNQRSYVKWRATLSKDFYLSRFRKLHVAADYLDGRRLDRFSKYEFGSFGGLRLHGFRTGSVRAERAGVLHLSYGYNVGGIFRLEGFYDSAWVTDRVAGLHRTYFSGAGIGGSSNGPLRNSIVRFDLGIPVSAHGVRGAVVNVLLLKLFE